MRAVLALLGALCLAGCNQMPQSIAGIPVKPVFIGYLRQGFEQSDFYPMDAIASGPWWVTVAEGEQAKFDVAAQGEGRGRAVIAEVILQADEKGPVDFGFRPKLANSLHVNEVLSVKPMTDQQFQDVTKRAQKER